MTVSIITSRDRARVLFAARGMGENGDDTPFRKHFVADRGDAEVCETLEGEGFMAFIGSGVESGGKPAYRVTDAGCDLADRFAAGRAVEHAGLADGDALAAALDNQLAESVPAEDPFAIDAGPQMEPVA